MFDIFFLASLLLGVSNTPAKVSVDKEKVLERHNYYRNLVGVEDLQYSEECAEFAQSWAESLAKKDRGLYHSDSEKYGENVFWASYNASVEEAIEEWAFERKYFNKKTRKYTSKVGHYSQMVWRDTKFVGMGAARSKSGGVYWVASYYPPGNWQGEKAY